MAAFKKFRMKITGLLGVVRPFFHWKFSQVIISLLFGSAVAMAMADKYGLSYFFWVLTFIWAAMYWITSDTLEKRRPKKRKKDASESQLDAYKKAMRQFGIWRWVPILVFFGLFVIGSVGTRSIQLQKELDSLEGWLYPANDPTPVNSCSWVQSMPVPPGYPNNGRTIVPQDALLVLLGPLAAMSTQFPSTVITIDGEQILTMDRDSRGAVTVSTDIYDKDHDIVAALDKNSYAVIAVQYS